jgi:hypothetical protein
MSPIDLDGLSPAELRGLVEGLLTELAALQATVAAQREEIARLKGGKGPPRLRPSGMERASEPPRPPGGTRGRGPVKPRLAIDEDRILRTAAPAGARFKGYKDYVVQDLLIRPQVVRYRRACWRLPDGRCLTAPPPAGLDGHFGPALRRFVLALYHQGQTTVARLTGLLRAIGVLISQRQVLRLLNEQSTGFVGEAAAVLKAGLARATWLAVDDTGARHKARNGYCLRLGDDRFTAFLTRPSKSRQSFLALLCRTAPEYVVNGAALAHMRACGLPHNQVTRLARHPQTRFVAADAWQAHLAALGLAGLRQTPDVARIATEAALWGCAVERGLAADLRLLSDGAGQYRVGRHALCWVHLERGIHALPCTTRAQSRAVARVRADIWDLYARLKAWRRDPDPAAKPGLARRFDQVFRQRTRYPALTAMLARLSLRKAELLAVLDLPDLPLHTNAAENDLRAYVTRRKISAGTRSDQGRDSRDALLSLLKTAAKHRIAFWDYLADRLQIPGAKPVPYLPQLITAATPT